MGKYIMVFDQKSTKSRCVLFNKNGEIIGEAEREIKTIYPETQWVEHDAIEIWATQFSAAIETMARFNISSKDIVSIGITNQRETFVVWDRRTGVPIYNAISWQCSRTGEYCEQINNNEITRRINEKTGLILHPYFSATKLKWILDNVHGARKEAEKGNLCFGTIDSWLLWNLTKGEKHITDYTNASRTMLFNINTLQWDEELLSYFDIPIAMMPEVMPSSHLFGHSDKVLFGKEIAVSGIAGDQQAALFGQTSFEDGMAKNTYSTGCFMLMNIGDKPIKSNKGLLTTIAWATDNEVKYALEGSIFMAGEAIKWISEDLRMIKTPQDSIEYALTVTDTNGVYMVPAFAGLGAPYWDTEAKGVVVGLTRGSKKEHFIRAVLESLAYQSCDVLKVMEEESGIRLKHLRVDGETSMNSFVMKFQADILNCKVQRHKDIESTAALGAAYLSGLSVKFWENKDDILRNNAIDKEFIGQMGEKQRENLLKGWHEAVKRSKSDYTL
ncbi:glycerol kinase GlpK [Clostridium rectalis]|uniref:glycerol kinase GlpK n=1 Tax=Clostridium rectalis TaxID=2040295 RepID=UPI000F636694|nr:glycerol kinase GlpK [Clostridium rectalis]